MHAGKINIVALLAALGLFFVPWIEVQCQGSSFIKQSGLQTALGTFTVDDSFPGKAEMKPKPGEKGPQMAIWAAASGGLAVLAFLLSLTAAGNPDGSKASSYLAVLALAVGIAQVMIGFPVETELKKEMSKEKPKSDNPMDAMMSAQINNMLKVKIQPGLYGYLAALAVPTLLGFLASPGRRGPNPPYPQ